jgi:hypothetical protein
VDLSHQPDRIDRAANVMDCHHFFESHLTGVPINVQADGMTGKTRWAARGAIVNLLANVSTFTSREAPGPWQARRLAVSRPGLPLESASPGGQ